MMGERADENGRRQERKSVFSKCTLSRRRRDEGGLMLEEH
jgi:hypothetical protein